MPFLRRLLERLDALMTASAFAEEGEAETARQLLGEDHAEERHIAPQTRAGARSRSARRHPGRTPEPLRAKGTAPLPAERPARRTSRALRVS